MRISRLAEARNDAPRTYDRVLASKRIHDVRTVGFQHLLAPRNDSLNCRALGDTENGLEFRDLGADEIVVLGRKVESVDDAVPDDDRGEVDGVLEVLVAVEHGSSEDGEILREGGFVVPVSPSFFLDDSRSKVERTYPSSVRFSREVETSSSELLERFKENGNERLEVEGGLFGPRDLLPALRERESNSNGLVEEERVEIGLRRW